MTTRDPAPEGRWIALTGTPGVGKTTVANALRERAAVVTDVRTLAEDAGLLADEDPTRPGTFVVDEDALAAHFERLPRPRGIGIVEGHFAHDLPVDRVIVLRLDPLQLLERLRARGWPEEKVRENVEAEALDVVAGDVLDTDVPAAEVDATGQPVEGVADAVWAIAVGDKEALKSHPVGAAAWPMERLPWF